MKVQEAQVYKEKLKIIRVNLSNRWERDVLCLMSDGSDPKPIADYPKTCVYGFSN